MQYLIGVVIGFFLALGLLYINFVLEQIQERRRSGNDKT